MLQSEEAISLVDSAQSAIEPILKTRPWPVQRFFVQTVWICKTLTTRLSIHFKQKDILITYLHVIIFVRHHISFSNFRFQIIREGMPAWKVYNYMSVLVAYLRQWECVEAKHLSDIFIILRLMQKITTLALTLLWRYIPGFVLSHISFYLCYLQDTDIIPALSNSGKLDPGHPNWRMRWGWLDKLTLTGRGSSYSPSAG